MRYVSTRGAAPELGFADVVLEGLATDGGLYVPVSWPTLPTGLSRGHADLATDVIMPYVGTDFDRDAVSRLCHEAYATFRHPDVVPLVEIEPNLFFSNELGKRYRLVDGGLEPCP